MPDESPNTFDDIKPFLRMLEGSIDQARAKRLSREGHVPAEPARPRPGMVHSTDKPIVPHTDSPSNPPENGTAERTSGLPKARKIPFGKRSASMAHGVEAANHSSPVATPRYRLS